MTEKERIARIDELNKEIDELQLRKARVAAIYKKMHDKYEALEKQRDALMTSEEIKFFNDPMARFG